MENVNRWYFTKEQLEDTPSRRCGIDANKELSYRQQAANFIQDMGQRLQVSQLCINTAIVYMHRFYMFHSFSSKHRNSIAVCALFLAAKIEEQPRKLEHVIKVAHMCLHRDKDEPTLDVKSTVYQEKQYELVSNENVMLQTLGFEIAIEHPHTYVVKLCQLVKASKDLAQTSYFMATNSLHLTTMCLQYKPTVVACVCIHLACKWANLKIEPCSEGKEWYYYVDKSVTPEQLEAITKEFIAIIDRCPNRLKRRGIGATKDGHNQSGTSDKKTSDQQASERVERPLPECKLDVVKKEVSPIPSTSLQPIAFIKQEISEKPKQEENLDSSTVASFESCFPSSPPRKLKLEASHSISLAVYREKREKERLVEQQNVNLEMPLPSPLVSKSSTFDKYPVVNHEKKHKPHSKSELLQRTPEKSSKTLLNSHVTTTTPEKINHHTKLHVDVNHSKNISLTKDVRNSSENNTSDPFVLLTRVDQPSTDKHFRPVGVSRPVSDSLDSSKSSNAKVDDEFKKRINVTVSADPVAQCDSKRSQNAVEPVQSLRPKHQKQKTGPALLYNNHIDFQTSSQGNPHSPAWDGAKANGASVLSPVPDSNVSNQSQIVQEVQPTLEIPKSNENLEFVSKHEKKEKHRHKHSSHSSNKEKNSHNSEQSSKQPMPLKITIPKDKISLSRSDPIQKSNSVHKSDKTPKEILKIKIKTSSASLKPLPPPPPPPPEAPKLGVKTNNSGAGLKLVFTKDKNAGSYSATHKADRSSRKRERSPKVASEHSSKNSQSSTSGRPAKIPKVDHTSYKNPVVDGVNSATGTVFDHKISRNLQHEIEPRQNAASMKQSNVAPPYHQANDVNQQAYMMAYGSQAYYQKLYQYSGQPNTTAALPYGHPLSIPPPPPPSLNAVPPPPPPPLPPPPKPPLPPE